MNNARFNATPDTPAETPARHRRFGFNLHRLMVVSLALSSLMIAWAYMATISRSDPWYRNTDMNIHNMVDALAINSDLPPKLFTQPAVPLKYLLALDYRVRHYLGALPVWNMKKLGSSADPLREIPPLIRIGRDHSRILVMLLILSAAGLTYTVTRELDSTCLAVILLCGSAGLLFQGLLTRPELLCVGFGNILAVLCTWRALSTRSWVNRHAFLFLAGLFIGWATLEKLPGVFYFLLCYAVCWWWSLAAQREKPGSDPIPAQVDFWSGLLPVTGGLSVLWLVFQLGPFHDILGPVVVLRLRVATVVISVLPLLGLWRPAGRVSRFLLERVRELALLGGGALAALTLSYLLLRAVMTEPEASEYLANELHFVIYPGPHMAVLATAQNVSGQFLVFFKETPFLFASATVLALGVCWLRAFPPRLKGLILLLWATALGLTGLMSRRYFAAQYSIFPQVPLLLVWAFSLSGLRVWWQQKHPSEGARWATPVALTAALVLMLSVYLRVQPKYYFYQDDVTLPVSENTLTFLYDHDNHMDAYLQIMKEHYGSREKFARVLEQYLADPANRY